MNTTENDANSSSPGSDVQILLASCQYPPDILRQRLAYHSLYLMQQKINLSDPLLRQRTCFLMAGDSIYADKTAGIFDPVDPKDRYQQAYRDLLSRKEAWSGVTPNVQFECTIDDHEINDNWEPPDCVSQMYSGKLYFLKYMRLDKKIDIDRAKTEPLWNNTTLDVIPLFLMDTRTERQARSFDNWHTASMIGKEQMDALERWLVDLAAQDRQNPGSQPVPKLIMSGSMLFPRSVKTAQSTHINEALKQSNSISTTLQSDSWDGYPATRQAILTIIAKNQIKNVIFLSGDEHLPCYCNFAVSCSDEPPVTVHSIHGSPLYAPFEFANAHEHDFVKSEQFELPAVAETPKLTINLNTIYPDTGNGYVQFVLPTKGTSHELSINFTGHDTEKRFTLSLDTIL